MRYIHLLHKYDWRHVNDTINSLELFNFAITLYTNFPKLSWYKS